MRGSVGDTYCHHGRQPTVLNDNTTKLRTALHTTNYPDPFRRHQNFQASDRIRKYLALLFSEWSFSSICNLSLHSLLHSPSEAEASHLMSRCPPILPSDHFRAAMCFRPKHGDVANVGVMLRLGKCEASTGAVQHKWGRCFQLGGTAGALDPVG